MPEQHGPATSGGTRVEPDDGAPDATVAEEPAEGKGGLRGHAKRLAVTFIAAILAGLSTWLVTSWTDNVDTYDVSTLHDADAINSTEQFGGKEYLFPGPINDVKPPPILDQNTCKGRYTWAHEQGAIDVSSTLARVTIRAKKDHDVVLVGARRVPAGEAKSPAIGSLLSCPGKGGPPAKHLYFNLDNDSVAYYDGKAAQPVDLNLPIAGGATEVLDIVASTEQKDWAYNIELTLTVDGEQKTELIDNNGKPFRTTPGINAKQYQWIDRKWVDVATLIIKPPPANMTAACSVVTSTEASSVLGLKLTTERNNPGTKLNADYSVSSCAYRGPNEETLQITFVDASSPATAKQRFNFDLAAVGGPAVAKDLTGFPGAKIINGADVLMLRADKVLRLNLSRKGRVDPLDAKYLAELVDIAIRRM